MLKFIFIVIIGVIVLGCILYVMIGLIKMVKLIKQFKTLPFASFEFLTYVFFIKNKKLFLLCMIP